MNDPGIRKYFRIIKHNDGSGYDFQIAVGYISNDLWFFNLINYNYKSICTMIEVKPTLLMNEYDYDPDRAMMMSHFIRNWLERAKKGEFDSDEDSEKK